jgi:hypothetical protein
MTLGHKTLALLFWNGGVRSTVLYDSNSEIRHFLAGSIAPKPAVMTICSRSSRFCLQYEYEKNFALL